MKCCTIHEIIYVQNMKCKDLEEITYMWLIGKYRYLDSFWTKILEIFQLYEIPENGDSHINNVCCKQSFFSSYLHITNCLITVISLTLQDPVFPSSLSTTFARHSETDSSSIIQ